MDSNISEENVTEITNENDVNNVDKQQTVDELKIAIEDLFRKQVEIEHVMFRNKETLNSYMKLIKVGDKNIENLQSKNSNQLKKECDTELANLSELQKYINNIKLIASSYIKKDEELKEQMEYIKSEEDKVIQINQQLKIKQHNANAARDENRKTFGNQFDPLLKLMNFYKHSNEKENVKTEKEVTMLDTKLEEFEINDQKLLAKVTKQKELNHILKNSTDQDIIEKNDAIEKLTKLKATTNTAVQEYISKKTRATDKIIQLKSNLSAENESISQLKIDITHLEEQHESQNQAMSAVRNDRDQLETIICDKEQDLTHLDKKFNELTDKLNKQRKILTENLNTFVEKRNEAEILNMSLKSDIENLMTKFNSQKAIHKDIQTQLKIQQDEMMYLENEKKLFNQYSETKYSEYDSLVNELNEKIKDICAKNEIDSDQNTKFETEAQIKNEIQNELKAKIDKITIEYCKRKENLQNKIESFAQEIETSTEDNKVLRETIENTEKNSEQLIGEIDKEIEEKIKEMTNDFNNRIQDTLNAQNKENNKYLDENRKLIDKGHKLEKEFNGLKILKQNLNQQLNDIMLQITNETEKDDNNIDTTISTGNKIKMTQSNIHKIPDKEDDADSSSDNMRITEYSQTTENKRKMSHSDVFKKPNMTYKSSKQNEDSDFSFVDKESLFRKLDSDSSVDLYADKSSKQNEDSDFSFVDKESLFRKLDSDSSVDLYDL